MHYKKEDYIQMTNLFINQNWLIDRKQQLVELLDFCESNENKELIFSLLNRFSYMNYDSLALILNDIAEYIIETTGFTESSTQVLSLTYDDEADSGQKILDQLKMPIFQKGWRSIKLVNQFGKSVKNYSKGKSQIVLVDEFIGSGKTLISRVEYLQKNIPGEFDLKCCFVAGMREAVEMVEEKLEMDIFCPLQLEKGISGHFESDTLKKATESMFKLESKLAQQINDKKLEDYSFGYGKAEALYSMEGCNGNTPNSVFPIFWWLSDVHNKSRNTILTRFETGF